MKFSSKKQEQGSVLVISMVTCLAIATVLASYLALISTRYNLTVRSMDWNAAMPVLEAGIEEAMTHLHDDDRFPTANGWTAEVIGGQPVHTKRRDFANGSYFKVTLYNAMSANPIIYSSGFVPAPLRRGYISRTIRVNTTKIKNYPAAIAANGSVTLGSGIVDSYDSSLGGYSTTNSLGTNASIATNSQGTPAISVGTAHVYGPVTTGPGGTVTVGGGAIGDALWNATQSGIQGPSWVGNDMNVAFPTNAPPTGSLLPPPVILGQTVLGSGAYQLADFKSTGTNDAMIVTGKAILYVLGNISVSGGGCIDILPGASLTLYAGGNNSVSGNGIINNTGVATNFTYIGLPTNAKLDYSGKANFIGTINAPQADLKMSGSADIYGAVIVNSYSGSGSSAFHYDGALGVKPLILTTWREL